MRPSCSSTLADSRLYLRINTSGTRFRAVNRSDALRPPTAPLSGADKAPLESFHGRQTTALILIGNRGFGRLRYLPVLRHLASSHLFDLELFDPFVSHPIEMDKGTLG